MNILLLSRYFPPEIGTAANLFYDLALGLTKRGHDVTVVTGFPWYNLNDMPDQYKGKIWMVEECKGITIKRLSIPVWGPLKIKLAAGHITAPFSALLAGITCKRPDIIYAYSPPLPFGISGWLLKSIKDNPFILGVQDIHPQCYIDQGVLKNQLLIKILELTEKFCYRHASKITVHSEGNKDHIVRKKRIPENKVIVVPNWIDTEEIKPMPRYNDFSGKNGLDGKFIVGYAGTLGLSQGASVIVEAAAMVKNHEDIEFFIVGDGLEKDALVQRVKELCLNNVRFLPMQPKEVYPWILASCDVSLVTLNSKVLTPVVPSKILSIMAAGRPILASMPLDGDAPKLIKESNGGLCVEPENAVALAEAIIFLARHPEKRDEMARRGRAYIEKTMSLEKVIIDLEILFETIISEYRRV